MRILHTADWHLGHRLYERDRTEEHRAALAWLLQTIEEERVDLLVIAGDIFDVTNPANQARELYYDFLGKLIKTRCEAAVIIGGNHDSATMLDAPRGLLQSLQLHVVGAARAQVQSEVLRIAMPGKDSPSVLVAAVPYLRERDLRKGQFGEKSEDRLTAMRAGIRQHYEEVAAAAEAMRQAGEPIIATGHLFASGATDAEDKKSHIYQADEHNIDAGHFPDCFDYVALGHVHRAQSVGEKDHVRYSGSLIPLTFVEGQRPRSVRIVDLGKAGEKVSSHKLEVPYARNLHRVNGPLESILLDLQTLATRYLAEKPALQPWVEVKIQTDTRIPNLRRTLLDAVRAVSDAEGDRLPLEIVRISTERQSPVPQDCGTPQDTRQLNELDPEDVFTRLLATEGSDAETTTALLSDFRTLRNWMNDEMTAE
ncbi:exonuclease SbcCD subunit D C-terminal domain-containing protein [Neolewinella agarilytica]|uniref:exonuclease SbcCD subunit D C-terminal domain-containing protein n=1 Tax=Neolewinella agarilytica TaxID=478744 RepID=UPI0023534057|nr:exonuclease SbcCD subunit D C-terminal domain-containing protein [Neolewinella agarilytica]